MTDVGASQAACCTSIDAMKHSPALSSRSSLVDTIPWRSNNSTALACSVEQGCAQPYSSCLAFRARSNTLSACLVIIDAYSLARSPKQRCRRLTLHDPRVTGRWMGLGVKPPYAVTKRVTKRRSVIVRWSFIVRLKSGAHAGVDCVPCKPLPSSSTIQSIPRLTHSSVRRAHISSSVRSRMCAAVKRANPMSISPDSQSTTDSTLGVPSIRMTFLTIEVLRSRWQTYHAERWVAVRHQPCGRPAETHEMTS